MDHPLLPSSNYTLQLFYLVPPKGLSASFREGSDLVGFGGTKPLFTRPSSDSHVKRVSSILECGGSLAHHVAGRNSRSAIRKLV